MDTRQALKLTRLVPLVWWLAVVILAIRENQKILSSLLTGLEWAADKTSTALKQGA